MQEQPSPVPKTNGELSVVAVGCGGPRSPLIRRIRANGFRPIPVANPEAFEAARTPILVYSPKLGDSARSVLEKLQARCFDSPVVVLTDHADFGHYYDVMSAGAYEYIDLSDEGSLERLRRALARAIED